MTLSSPSGADLGDDRDDLRRADVEADDQVLAVLHYVTVPRSSHVAHAAGLRALFAERRHARRESVAIAQVDRVDLRARARERAERAADARSTKRARRASGSSRPSSSVSGAVGARGLQAPAAARRQAHLGESQRERPQRVRPRAIALGHLARRAPPGPRSAAARRATRAANTSPRVFTSWPSLKRASGSCSSTVTSSRSGHCRRSATSRTHGTCVERGARARRGPA